MSKALEGSILCAVLFLLAVGCSGESGGESARPGLTQRERDSVLAESRLPGAQGVKTTLTVADSANARTERLNKLSE
jgi:hypothetical protein